MSSEAPQVSRFSKHMLSGAVAGTMEHLAMYPVDTIKTRMQASTSSAQMPSASFVRNLQVIATREGLKGFYRGAAAVAVSAGPAHALYFATYERIKELCVPSETAAARRRRGGRASASELAGYSVAGATATMASDAIATPLDVVKQRMQLAHTNYRSVFECASRILRKEGFGAFFRSYRTTVAMNVPYTIVHFPVYEFAKRFLEPERQSSSLLQAIEEEFDEDEAGAEGNEGTWTHLLAGGAAGGVAAAITTPMDVVKTRMQIGMDCAGARASSAIMPVVQSLIRKEGMWALWKGIVPRVLFHAPSTAICWAAYEGCKNFVRG